MITAHANGLAPSGWSKDSVRLGLVLASLAWPAKDVVAQQEAATPPSATAGERRLTAWKDIDHSGFAVAVAWRRAGRELGLLQFRGPLQVVTPPRADRLDDPLKTTTTFAGPATHFAFDPEDETLAYDRDTSKDVVIEHRRSGERVVLPTGVDQPALAFTSDGRHLMTGSYGREARLWRVADGTLARTFTVTGTDGALTSAFSPDGRLVAIGNRNDRTHLFDVESGALLRVLEREQSHGLAFSPDSRWLAVAYVDGKVAIWDAATGAQVKLLACGGKEAYAVAWSPDGELLATAGLEAPVTVWSTQGFRELQRVDPGSKSVHSLAFRPNCRMLAAAGDKRMRIWTISPPH